MHAKPTSWTTFPIDNPKRIAINLRFTQEQFEKIQRGLIPDTMDDKWFIYFENDWLYFHRSWTGYGVYKCKVDRDESGYFISELWAERNAEKYGLVDDKKDVELFSRMIVILLLERL
jgi:hypothetical protein